jgi:inhibitor of KinA
MRTRFLLAGDSCIVVEFGDEIAPELNRNVRCMFLSLNQAGIQGVTELIPTYRSLYIQYDPLEISLEELKRRLKKSVQEFDEVELPSLRVVDIPTVYGGRYGPDLEFVAEYNGLTEEEVVEIHTSSSYLVYMIGFTPGFAYLGGVSKRIATPRLETPRLKVPAGSVGLAGEQTGVYPVESPGGWRLIGCTPIRIFDPGRDLPVILQPTSDYVRFVRISEEEFRRIKEQVEAGQYEIRIRNIPE